MLLTLFVGSVQVEPAWQPEVTPVIVDAVVGSLCPAPSLNWVDVTVTFQPPPTASPRASTTWIGRVYERRLVVAVQRQAERRGAVPRHREGRPGGHGGVDRHGRGARRGDGQQGRQGDRSPDGNCPAHLLRGIIDAGSGVPRRETVGKGLERPRLPPGRGMKKVRKEEPNNPLRPVRSRGCRLQWSPAEPGSSGRISATTCWRRGIG